ncbi:MAG: NAD(P)-binding protein [Gammaproteobacteria bacterium]|nr:NAD(P)-binding protein [Gammaproteobacteria bacterium]MCP4088375.1 NAD(P)-binding protein [Gammaproteobacteria bacterium]MCP4275086.1 NAD(P)-binding protein [Gammaproteobacteria bacterium]MCP4830961.1 NAD(P)-binding protein [Gammaproteobacteria bacterium]MCP4927518.1 NAD(P)-binding protein [Gammaproteobacteria bacterium]
MQTLILPKDGEQPRVSSAQTAVIAGGGLAGIAAAVVLAERGVSVVLAEREDYLGGRAGAWTDQLSSGEKFQMERGFHAFFRQYYNVRSLLRRIDPQLACLKQLDDYPILGPGGQVQSFSGLPVKPPWNVIALTKQAPTLSFLDLIKVNKTAALAMMQYERDWTYGNYDQMTAGAYLLSLNFPPDAHQMLFDVFARSFFNPGEDMSGAELLMMFHFYFAGNPEGLIFDVVNKPFSTAIWKPLENYLKNLGVDVRSNCTVTRVATGTDKLWSVELNGEQVQTDHVVLALNVPALQLVVAASPDLNNAGFRSSVESLGLTNPFAVWRLWLDQPANSDRKAFAGTTGIGSLDNISLYHLFEDESAEWVEQHGGAVVELHAYGVEPGTTEEELREDLLHALHSFYPEFVGANVIDERFLMRGDCPAFAPGSDAIRPDVATAHEGITLAGDFVRLPLPTALMERAVASGYLAANTLLAPQGIKPEPIYSIPLRGIFGRHSRLKAVS